jgi:hypothetical protein
LKVVFKGCLKVVFKGCLKVVFKGCLNSVLWPSRQGCLHPRAFYVL